MRSWRAQKGRRLNARQLTIPGLFGSLSSSDSSQPSLKPSSPSEFALLRAKGRLVLVFICFALSFVVVSARVSFLTLDGGPQDIPVVQALSPDLPVTARADITDRNGTLLATSLPTVMLLADTRKILEPQDAAEKLAHILPDLDAQKLAKEIEETKRYVTIRRHITPKQYYEINRMGIVGLEFVPDESRIYPAGSLTSHIVGYTDIDNKGIAGLEKSQNDLLQKQQNPLVTTIDVRLQTILHRELDQAIETFQALGAAGLIMDANNGEVLALVSLPDYNPQEAGEASDNAKFNRATLGVYEMGSTFKTFNTALALETGVTTPSERFDTTQPIEIGSRVIRDFHASDHWLSVAEIFTESSNIGSARMAERVGAQKQRDFLTKIGLTTKSPLELPEVGAPLVPSASSWKETTTMTIAYGHGIAVNAVQLTSAVAAMVNGGFAVKPTLLKRESTEQDNQDEKTQVLSAKTVEQMQALMRLAVTHGTAKQADVEGYMVGGKTGTADKVVGRGYNTNARLSSFIGVFPAHAPRYLVLALLDDPKGNAKTYGYATGGWTAAPVVGRVIRQIGPLLSLPPVETDLIEATENKLLRPLGPKVLQSLENKKETESYASFESHNAQ